MFFYPRKNIGQVEYGAFARADWVFEGLKGHGAEVEGQALEAGAHPGIRGLARICASAGGEGILTGPLAVGDL